MTTKCEACSYRSGPLRSSQPGGATLMVNCNALKNLTYAHQGDDECPHLARVTAIESASVK